MLTKNFILSLVCLMLIQPSAFAIWPFSSAPLTDSEQAAQARFQSRTGELQKELTDADIQYYQYDYVDYLLQQNQAKIDAAQKIVDNTNAEIQRRVTTQKIPADDPSLKPLQDAVAAQTKTIENLQTIRDGDPNTVGLKDAQNDIGKPDPQAVPKIVNQTEVAKKDLTSELQALGNAGLGKNDDKVAQKLSKSDYKKMQDQSDKSAQDFMAAKYSKDELKAFKDWRKTHPETSLTPPKPAQVAQAPAPQSATAAVPAPAATAAPTTPPPPAPVAIEHAAPPAPPPAPKAPDVSCDQVYVELAQLIMAKPENGKILSNMVKSAAIKMAALTSGTTKNESLQTLESYARSTAAGVSDADKVQFAEKLTDLYKISNQDATRLVATLQASPTSTYFNKNVRFQNEDASAFVYYLSTQKGSTFTTADAAAVWAQGQIFKNMNLSLGSTAGNSMNFSSQVYYLNNDIQVWKKKDIAVGSQGFDGDTAGKIQATVDAVFKDTNQKALIDAIQAKGCLKQDDNKTSCDANKTKLGSDSLESIKEKIAAMASQKQMQGVSNTYTLSNPTFDADGSFHVDSVKSALAAAPATTTTANTTTPVTSATTTATRNPAAQANGTASPTTSNTSTVPVITPPAGAQPQTSQPGQHVHGQGWQPGQGSHHHQQQTGETTPAADSTTPPAQ